MPETFTVYGYRRISPRRSASMHREGLKTFEDAMVWIMDHVMEHGPSEVHAVVVKLDKGVDKNGERHVVRRIGEGKAWWE